MAGLDSIDHLVVLMLENRGFDHMVGFLYSGVAGAPDFVGLDGTETNPDPEGHPVPVSKITAQTENAYWYPLCNPSEGYAATNQQLFGSATPPVPPVATNQGFVTSFASDLQHPLDPALAGAEPASIMAVYTPELLPVLSGLARGYAICDGWFASVPSETMPNRAFALAGTSLGRVSNTEKYFDTPSIFGALTAAEVTWRVYGYTSQPLTQLDFPDTKSAPAANFGLFTDFQHDAASGNLPSFAFLEPRWANYSEAAATNEQQENDQHPVSSLATGEQLIHDVYQAVKEGPDWATTLLVITYDEHGGCYDHVAPPTDAVAPDDSPGESGFDFQRFGLRVPTLLVSPLIAPSTVHRAPAGGPPFDHTSLLATIRARWGTKALTKRDAVAPHFGDVLSLSQPRSDDPLAGVNPPVYSPPTGAGSSSVGGRVSRFLRAHARLAADLPLPGSPIGDPGQTVSSLETPTEIVDFIDARLRAWNESKPQA